MPRLEFPCKMSLSRDILKVGKYAKMASSSLAPHISWCEGAVRNDEVVLGYVM